MHVTRKKKCHLLSPKPNLNLGPFTLTRKEISAEAISNSSLWSLLHNTTIAGTLGISFLSIDCFPTPEFPVEQEMVKVAKAPLIKRVVRVVQILEVSDSVSGHKFPRGQALNDEVGVETK